MTLYYKSWHHIDGSNNRTKRIQIQELNGGYERGGYCVK
jgi:hypothetical protein